MRKKLYLCNIWEEHISWTGREILEKNGWDIYGNWINDAPFEGGYDVVLLAIAGFGKNLLPSFVQLQGMRVFNMIMYPDILLGWDWQKNTYKKEPNKTYGEYLKRFPILSHSDFSLNLLQDTYGKLNDSRETIYLPIEFEQISHISERIRNYRQGNSVSVLWNHMWRSDKGVVPAMYLILKLSQKYPKVTFTIGRLNKWGDAPDVPDIQKILKPVIESLQKRGNVLFKEQYKDVKEYWEFISKFDIAFSTSFHEGFGLSILEQAAAGAACIVPDAECYPEVDRGAIISQNVERDLDSLITDEEKRQVVAQNCLANAKRFNAKDWARVLLRHIN